MSAKRYGTVIVEKLPGTDLPGHVVRFLREIEKKEFQAVYEGDVLTNLGRHTGYHHLFEEWDETNGNAVPEYKLELSEEGSIQLLRF